MVEFFRIQRVVRLKEDEEIKTNLSIIAIARHCSKLDAIECYVSGEKSFSQEGRDMFALAMSDGSVVIRSTEDEHNPRNWTLPLQLDNEQDQIIALEFSTNGEWLVCASQLGQLRLLPISRLITSQRAKQMQQQSQRMHAEGESSSEGMNVTPGPMAVEMMSYLSIASELPIPSKDKLPEKATSYTPSDEYDSFILQLAEGFGNPTCLQWWDSSNGTPYVLVGSTDGLVSFVNIQEKREVCRCELSHARVLERIDLVTAVYSNEYRTSMLVTSTEKVMFKVVLERQLQTGTTVDTRTFPVHFQDDYEFRPKKITRFDSVCRLFSLRDNTNPLRGKRDSCVGLFNPQNNSLTVYSNLNWRLQRECYLSEQIDEVLFCSTQIMLAISRENGAKVLLWISIPPSGYYGRSSDDGGTKAQVIQRMKLASNEEVLSVLPHNATQGQDLSISHAISTSENVYECRSRWSKVMLFKSLSVRSVSLEHACIFGFALKINMKSITEIVADGLCEQVACMDPDLDDRHEESCRWILELYEFSKAPPSKIARKLIFAKGYLECLTFARKTLNRSDKLRYHPEERQKLAHLILECFICIQVISDTHNRDAVDLNALTSPREELMEFLCANRDYETSFATTLLLNQNDIEAAFMVAISREGMDVVVTEVSRHGIGSLPDKVIDLIIEREYADYFTTSSRCRLLLRSCDIQSQARLLVAYPPSILSQRDFVLRALPQIAVDICREMAQLFDPRSIHSKVDVVTATFVEENPLEDDLASDIGSSERMVVQREERLELFLTILLRLNSEENIQEDPYSYGDLVSFIRQLSGQYRASVMALRCFDYKNWGALGEIYAAHGAYAEEADCRLLQCTLVAERSNSTGDTNNEIRHELIKLLTEFLKCPENGHINKLARVSTLSRLLLQWFEHGFNGLELERWIIEKDRREILLPVFADILFGDPSSFSSTKNAGVLELQDVEFCTQCQALPFSGTFLSEVFYYLIESMRAKSPAYARSILSMDKLFEMVLENVEKHRGEKGKNAVPIMSDSITRLRKRDRTEAHVVVFTCQHCFSRAKLRNEILPQLEKLLNTFPKSLYNTKKLLLQQYSQPRIECACPYCVYAALKQMYYQQHPAQDSLSTLPDWKI